jgi:hypothetical protein
MKSRPILGGGMAPTHALHRGLRAGGSAPLPTRRRRPRQTQTPRAPPYGGACTVLAPLRPRSPHPRTPQESPSETPFSNPRFDLESAATQARCWPKTVKSPEPDLADALSTTLPLATERMAKEKTRPRQLRRAYPISLPDAYCLATARHTRTTRRRFCTHFAP